MPELYYQPLPSKRFSAVDGAFFVMVTFHGQPLAVPFVAFTTDLLRALEEDYGLDDDTVLYHEEDLRFMNQMEACMAGRFPLEQVDHHEDYLDTESLEHYQYLYDDIEPVKNIPEAFERMSDNYLKHIRKSPYHHYTTTEIKRYRETKHLILEFLMKKLRPYFPELVTPLTPPSPTTFL